MCLFSIRKIEISQMPNSEISTNFFYFKGGSGNIGPNVNQIEIHAKIKSLEDMLLAKDKVLILRAQDTIFYLRQSYYFWKFLMKEH